MPPRKYVIIAEMKRKPHMHGAPVYLDLLDCYIIRETHYRGSTSEEIAKTRKLAEVTIRTRFSIMYENSGCTTKAEFIGHCVDNKYHLLYDKHMDGAIDNG